MKNPSSNEPSPFSSSTHDPKLAGQPASNQPATTQPVSSAPVQGTPNPNVPASVQNIMAANARGQLSGGAFTLVASSYKASGKVGPNAFMPMFLATLVGAGATGALYFWMAPHFNTVMVSQAILGAILGCVLLLGVRFGRVRSTRYAASFAVAGTLLVFAVFHGASVWSEREQILDFYAPAIAKTTRASVASTRARLEKRFTLARAAQVYGKDLFANGVTLRETSSSKRASAVSTGTHLAGWGYVAFLLAEIGFTALVAAGIASVATTARFSETQGRWYSKKRIFAVGGKEVESVLRALQSGDWSGARQTATERKWKVADVAQVHLSTVPGEEGGWVQMTMTQDKQQKLLFEAEVDGQAVLALSTKT